MTEALNTPETIQQIENHISGLKQSTFVSQLLASHDPEVVLKSVVQILGTLDDKQKAALKAHLG